MGQNKLLLPINGKSMIENVLDALEAAGIPEPVVVLGNEPGPVIEVLKPKLGRVKIALNLEPQTEMASSFQTGLTVISGVDAAFLVLGDEPILDPDFLAVMAKNMENNPEILIVSPIHNGKKGHPLLFRKELFGEILSLTGKQTMREIVHGHADKLVLVRRRSGLPWMLIRQKTMNE